MSGMDGQEVRVFHLCEDGSTPGSGTVICELSLLLMFFSFNDDMRDFLWVLHFTSLKPKINNTQIRKCRGSECPSQE